MDAVSWGRGARRENRLLAVMAMAGMLALSACGDDTVDRAELEQEVSTQLEAEVGVAPRSVDCPDDLDAEVSASTRCVLTADDGTRIGVTVSVTGTDGGRVRFSIEVDDRPLP